MFKNLTLSVIYTITFILCLILLRVQSKVKRLRSNPGQILFGILLSESMICLLSIFSQFYVVTEYQELYQIRIKDKTCKLLAIPSLIIFMIYNLLNVLLIANLYCQMHAKNYRNFNLKQEVILTFILLVSVSILSVVISQDLGVSILGDCNLESENVFSTFLVYLRGVLMIILSSILIRLLKYTPEILYTEIYKTLVDKFIRKYLQTYIKVNVAYGLLFIIARLLIPIILNYCKYHQTVILICQYFQAIITLIMTIIRFHEPIIHRHAKYLFRPKKCVLQQRLLDNPNENSEDSAQKSYDNIQITNNGQDISSIEIKVYKQQQKNGSISLSLEQYLPLTLLPQESAYNNVLPINFIQHQGHQLLQQLIESSYNILEDYQYSQNDEMSSYQFNKIQQKEITNNNGLKILITTYGQDILSFKMREYFGITLKQFKNSINVQKNLQLFQIQNLPESGTILITHDNLLSLEFVTKDQKRQLTKGGGLQVLWQRFEQEFNCQLGIFVPVIIGLHSYYVNNEYFTIIYKLNRLNIRYPLLDDLWYNEQLIKELIKQNIIGWITIEDGIFFRRYLAKEVLDGQYQIKFNRNDFLLSENDKQSLIDMIRRDHQTMQQMKSSLTLQFVYTKHTSARLNSLAGKEKKEDSDQSIDSKKLQKNKIIGSMASFELKTKLGYLEVFWDNCWKYMESDIEKIIEIVNERF